MSERGLRADRPPEPLASRGASAALDSPFIPANDKYAFAEAVDACAFALTHRPCGLVTDVDGTIAPIVLDPTQSAVRPGSRDALAALAHQLDFVAVLTGREPEVARAMVGLETIEYFGIHGMVRWSDEGPLVHPDAGRFVEVIRSAARTVRERLDLPGILIEVKGPTLAVHYRQTRNPTAMHQLILQELGPIATQAGLAIFEGRMVVELRPPPPLGKGWTIEDIACNRDLASLIYLGDDRTDIEAFEAIRDWREEAPGRYGVALAVASTEMPHALVLAADFVLDEVTGVELLLRELAIETAQH
jgi:trehalose 6-phosphate phosphatase